MDGSKHILFQFFETKITEGVPLFDILKDLSDDNDLLSTANSYCQRCGGCCVPQGCKNLTVTTNGLVECLLHTEPYPNNKCIPTYLEVLEQTLDPNEHTKPFVCHVHGVRQMVLDYNAYLALS